MIHKVKPDQEDSEGEVHQIAFSKSKDHNVQKVKGEEGVVKRTSQLDTAGLPVMGLFKGSQHTQDCRSWDSKYL